MTAELLTLGVSAASISCLHTVTGPDHYLPFIVLSRSHKWSMPKTILLTIICGLGHILSSVMLGGIGLVMGWQLSKLTWFQNYRGNISGWCLLIFGCLYLCWGLFQAYRNKPHKHFDVMNDDVYVFEHRHGELAYPKNRIKVTPLVLFAVFVMGPSEPLVPLLFYSGMHRSTLEIALLIAVFAVMTVLTMLTMVLIGLMGYSYIQTDKLERYVHAIGGFVVAFCGVGMVFLGW